MSSSTLKFSLSGNTHYEIMTLVEQEISNYLGIDSNDLSRSATDIKRHVNYEVVVEKSQDGKYEASVVARIKDGTK